LLLKQIVKWDEDGFELIRQLLTPKKCAKMKAPKNKLPSFEGKGGVKYDATMDAVSA
jgi:hypothetical protein